MKKIVLCCDGTKNQFGAENTNVIKLYSALDHDSPGQMAYYHPGLGSMGSPAALTTVSRLWTKVFGLAFGLGLSQHLADLYGYLMDHYQPEDKLYVFGFSRGAYTARALLGMLHTFGLVRNRDAALIPYGVRLLKSYGKRGNKEIAAQFRETFSSATVDQEFAGVWDTVSSVGAVYSPVHMPFTAFNPSIRRARHAIAVDERRAFYRQNLFHPAPGQDIEQVWFPGAHCDVGGGYPEQESGLSKIALRWMIDEAAAAGLAFSTERVALVLGGGEPYQKPNVAAKLHRSLSLAWWPLEVLPRFPRDPASGSRYFRLPFGRPRYIADGSRVHESVFLRREACPEYRPANVKDREAYVVVPMRRA